MSGRGSSDQFGGNKFITPIVARQANSHATRMGFDRTEPYGASGNSFKKRDRGNPRGCCGFPRGVAPVRVEALRLRRDEAGNNRDLVGRLVAGCQSLLFLFG
jgi:hypothetical protein